MENGYGAMTLTNCIVSGNSAQSGGGLENLFGAMTLANCAVDNNQAVASFDFATAEGGGILSYRWESLDLQQHTRREHGNRRPWSFVPWRSLCRSWHRRRDRSRGQRDRHRHQYRVPG